MNQLAEAIKRGLELGDGNVPGLENITFWYKIAGDASTDYVMENGETNLDGIGVDRDNAVLTLSRVGANLDIENTSGASITVNAVAITGGSISNGIEYRNILPETTITDIVIPDGQVARISGISFELIKQV